MKSHLFYQLYHLRSEKNTNNYMVRYEYSRPLPGTVLEEPEEELTFRPCQSYCFFVHSSARMNCLSPLHENLKISCT